MLNWFLCFSLFAFSSLAQARCTEYKKIHGLVNLNNKTWETTHINKKQVKVCGDLPEPPAPNLELTFVKDDKKFSTKVFRSIVGFWDATGKDKKFEGGTYKINHLSIETFAPEWFKGSRLTITEIKSGNVIIETNL